MAIPLRPHCDVFPRSHTRTCPRRPSMGLSRSDGRGRRRHPLLSDGATHTRPEKKGFADRTREMRQSQSEAVAERWLLLGLDLKREAWYSLDRRARIGFPTSDSLCTAKCLV